MSINFVDSIPQVEELTRRIPQFGREILPYFWRQGGIFAHKGREIPQKTGENGGFQRIFHFFRKFARMGVDRRVLLV